MQPVRGKEGTRIFEAGEEGQRLKENQLVKLLLAVSFMIYTLQCSS